jgi:hypothetical protein
VSQRGRRDPGCVRVFSVVSVAEVNIVGVELAESLDEAGFRHVAASVGGGLVARRIGASV